MVLWFCDSDLQCIDETLYYWTDVWNNKKTLLLHLDMQYESRTRCFIIHLTCWPRNLLTPAHIWLKWSGSYSQVSGRSDPAVMWVNTLVLLSFSGAMTRVEVKGCRLVDILHPSLQFERETEVKESDSSEIRRRWDVSLLCTILLIRTYLGCEVCDLLLLLFPVFPAHSWSRRGKIN